MPCAIDIACSYIVIQVIADKRSYEIGATVSYKLVHSSYLRTRYLALYLQLSFLDVHQQMGELEKNRMRRTLIAFVSL